MGGWGVGFVEYGMRDGVVSVQGLGHLGGARACGLHELWEVSFRTQPPDVVFLKEQS